MTKEKAARAEAYAKARAAWAKSNAEEKADRAKSEKRIELKEWRK
jgi:hypothetical protein